jgi:hypothetical protein
MTTKQKKRTSTTLTRRVELLESLLEYNEVPKLRWEIERLNVELHAEKAARREKESLIDQWMPVNLSSLKPTVEITHVHYPGLSWRHRRGRFLNMLAKLFSRKTNEP